MTWIFSAFADEAGAEIDEQIAALAQAGMTHIDLRGIGQQSIVELPENEAKQVRTKLDIGDDFAIDLQRLDRLAVMAEVFDCRAVRMSSYYNKDNRPAGPFQIAAETAVRLFGELNIDYR